MRITSKGQVTLLPEVRGTLGLEPQSEVGFVCEAGRVWLRKHMPRAEPGHSLVARMRGRATSGMSTEQIMDLVRGEEN